MKKKIPKYDFNNEQSFAFEITSIQAIYQKSRSKLILPHRQDFYGLFHFTNSSGVHIIDFEYYDIKKNDVFLISNEQVHYFKDIDKTEGNVILFTNSFLENGLFIEQIFEQHVVSPNQSLDLNQIKDVETLISQMKKVYISHKKRKIDVLKKYLDILLLEIYGKDQENPMLTNINYDRFVLFRKALKENYKTQKNVLFYANSQCISRKTLNLAVREIIDTSAKQFISDFIILIAKRMLVSTTFTSTDIAYELGFEEPTNFTKFFLKKMNMTPLMFRKGYKIP